MIQTVKCPICNEPYKIYDATTVDQSACPECVYKAERKEIKWRTRKAHTLPEKQV